ncbi:hypothetical protein OH77DRAFT_1424183 [Trametes cingulata]|nr:hypothetical protein OH77DRAFT_1424183 [Trametes cingulata]
MVLSSPADSIRLLPVLYCTLPYLPCVCPAPLFADGPRSTSVLSLCSRTGLDAIDLPMAHKIIARNSALINHVHTPLRCCNTNSSAHIVDTGRSYNKATRAIVFLARSWGTFAEPSDRRHLNVGTF